MQYPRPPRPLPPPPGFPAHLSPSSGSKIPCSKKCGICAGGTLGPLCSRSVFDKKRDEFFEDLKKKRKEFSKPNFDLTSLFFLMYVSMFRIHYGMNRHIPKPHFFSHNPDAIKNWSSDCKRLLQKLRLKFCFPPIDLCERVSRTQPDTKGCCLTQKHWKYLFPELKDSFPILGLFIHRHFLTRSVGLNFLIAQLIPNSRLRIKSLSNLRYYLARRILNSMQKREPFSSSKK